MRRGVLARALRGRRPLVILAATVVAIAGVLATNAVIRPGCSLLPVPLPADPNGGSQPATFEQVCAVLGRPVQLSTNLPDGVERGALLVDNAPPFDGPRFVTVYYTQRSHGVAILSIHRSELPVNADERNGTVAGAPAVINQIRPLGGESGSVSYLWASDGLVFTLHVQLTPPLTREAADELAASIR